MKTPIVFDIDLSMTVRVMLTEEGAEHLLRNWKFANGRECHDGYSDECDAYRLAAEIAGRSRDKALHCKLGFAEVLAMTLRHGITNTFAEDSAGAATCSDIGYVIRPESEFPETVLKSTTIQ